MALFRYQYENVDSLILSQSRNIMICNGIKQREELGNASCVIRELGFVPDISMCDDAPDSCLPSIENRLIGIEVTEYISDVKAKESEALEKILKEYARSIDLRTDKRFNISVRFLYGETPTGIHFNSIKNGIFHEMDSFYYSQSIPQNLRYVENVSLKEYPWMAHSYAYIVPSIYEYGDTKERLFLKCIKEKERRLLDYKNKSKNQTIKEYYLIIHASRLEHPEVGDYMLPTEVKTQYDRIYFVDDLMVNRLK